MTTEILKIGVPNANGGLSHDVFDAYVDNLKDSIPRYKQACDDIIVINNDLTKDELASALKQVEHRLQINGNKNVAAK